MVKKQKIYRSHLVEDLTKEEKEKAWSMLMNLNGEADRYPMIDGVYDNRDITIANRLGLDKRKLSAYLAIRSFSHLYNLKINQKNHENE